MKKIILLGLLVLAGAGCVSTKVTPHIAGDDALTLTEDERVLWEAADYIERKLSENQVPFYGEDAMERYLLNIVSQLAPEFFEGDPPKVRTHVLISVSPNAFVLPNGAIYVTSGMLMLLENEAQLATVLGHEFSHFKYRHHLQQERHDESARRTGALLGVFLAGLAGAATGTVDTNISSSAADLWARVSSGGYSRDLEREADKMGLIAVLEASYDPKQTVRAYDLLRKASEKHGKENQGLFASHPKLTERIQNYQEELRNQYVQSIVIGRRVKEQQYLSHVLPVMLPHAKLEMRLNRFAEARQTLTRYRKAFARDARANFLIGETFRHEARGKDDEKLISAVRYYQRALEFDADCVECYRELGLVYRTMGKQILSREYLTKYLELAPSGPDVLIIRSLFKQTEH